MSAKPHGRDERQKRVEKRIGDNSLLSKLNLSNCGKNFLASILGLKLFQISNFTENNINVTSISFFPKKTLASIALQS